jgi:predicted flavoprotein YhiN
MAKQYDVAVIGAGAAGMMCAATAAQRGKRVVLVDHAGKLAEKIRISGGGRCNFTNINAGPAELPVREPAFLPQRAVALHAAGFPGAGEKAPHRVPRKAPRPAVLRRFVRTDHRHAQGRVRCGRRQWRMPCKVAGITKKGKASSSTPTAATSLASNVVVATGGLSIPKIGATDLGYRIAKQFGLKIVEPRPGLVPLTFDGPSWQPFVPLAGIALEVDVTTGSAKGKNAKYGLSAKTCCSPTAACPARRSCRFPATGSRARPSC